MLRASPAPIEVRRAGDGSATIFGRFPYDAPTELAPGRREVFAAGAFVWRDDVHLLSQHEFARPLASTRARTLILRNGDAALEIEARLTARVLQTQAAADALALVEEGLAAGLSPGFTVPPDGAEVRSEGGGLLRVIRRAELLECSIVTRAAYPAATVEARSWALTAAPVAPRFRWRA